MLQMFPQTLLNVSFKRMMSSSSKKKLDFFYDVASPYSWFSFEVLLRYRKHWNVDLQLQPTLLGGLFKATNNASPLANSPPKAFHLNIDVSRCAKYFDVPLKPMDNIVELMTKGSLAPMQFLTALKLKFPQHLEEASRHFWVIRWNQDRDFTTPEALKEVGEVCGLSNNEIESLLSNLKSTDTKNELRRTTDYAVECGLFGVPSVVLHNNGKKEIFFGSDRFPVLAQEMGEEWRGPNPDKSSKL